MLIRVTEAAEILGVSRGTVFNMIARGDIPIVKIGRATRVPVAALRSWVERQTGGVA